MKSYVANAARSVRKLNKLFMASIAIVELVFFLVLLVGIHAFFVGDISIYSFAAIAIFMVWLCLVVGYLAWGIYFYNINLGLTDESWADIKRRQQLADSMREAGQTPDFTVQKPDDNPYQKQTLGLPNGTIRGIIALTLLVGAVSLFIYSMDRDTVVEKQDFFYDSFEFFKTAFLMMIAFYFGGRSLEVLRTGTVGGFIPRFGNKKTTEIPCPEEVTDNTPASDPPTEIPSIVAPLVTDEPSVPVQRGMALADTTIPIPTYDAHLLSDEDIAKIASDNQLEMAEVKAVIKVESGGSGFLADGRPKILFEGHKFWKHLADRKSKGEIANGPEFYATDHPDIVYPNWTKQYYLGGAAEYQRLEKAILIDRDSALQSASWGMFQILGENFAVVGFSSVEDFVAAQKQSEANQLQAFIKFIANTKLEGISLLEHLRAKHWDKFARGYNGPRYMENEYDLKLERAYGEFAAALNPNIAMALKREQNSTVQTLGTITVMESDTQLFSCKSLELPWLNNNQNVSCIPTGVYKVIKRYSDKYGNHFHVQNVPNRSEILIHSGNYFTQTRGCILVGDKLEDINNDGNLDVVNSKATLTRLNQILPNEFNLTIS